ncbi:MAG: hypothetical protein AAGI90_01965 [Chlamydiota bacterium]
MYRRTSNRSNKQMTNEDTPFQLSQGVSWPPEKTLSPSYADKQGMYSQPSRISIWQKDSTFSKPYRAVSVLKKQSLSKGEALSAHLFTVASTVPKHGEKHANSLSRRGPQSRGTTAHPPSPQLPSTNLGSIATRQSLFPSPFPKRQRANKRLLDWTCEGMESRNVRPFHASTLSKLGQNALGMAQDTVQIATRSSDSSGTPAIAVRQAGENNPLFVRKIVQIPAIPPANPTDSYPKDNSPKNSSTNAWIESLFSK